LFGRFKNIVILGVMLLAQLLGLAIQVKRPDRGNMTLLQIWVVAGVTPVEKAMVHTGGWFHQSWHDYFYLRSVRKENDRLLNENTHLRLDQVRLVEDASQAQRLKALLKFKEQFISETLPAQVVGTSGSEQSRVIYIDKGANDGVRADMAVITPRGIVGKVMRTFANTAQVLVINDQSSGVGAILEQSRLQGIVKGAPNGQTMLNYIMADEKVAAGEMVLTSGGDGIFPKGLPIGRVVSATPGRDTFLSIALKPSANLSRVEEVLVITKMAEQQPDLLPENPRRAADILAERLPTITVKAPDQAVPGQPGTSGTTAPGTTSPANVSGQATKPGTPGAPATRPAGAIIPPKPAPSAAGSNSPGTTNPAPKVKPKPPAPATAPPRLLQTPGAKSTQTVSPAGKPSTTGNVPTTKPAAKPASQNAVPPAKDTHQ
jgi:rod shape-determining protein MreC